MVSPIYFLFCSLLSTFPATADVPNAAVPSRPGPQAGGSAVQQGIAVEFAVEPVDAARRGAPLQLKEGDEVAFRFRVTDANTGTPLSGVYPAAWMDLLVPGLEESLRSCEAKVKQFVGGDLFARPAVDLNSYYVLTLNDDATIGVVDPHFHFGGTKLLNMVFLKSPGEDWALSADGRRLFVSLPESGQVAVADTGTWKVVAELASGPRPRRLALQPDQGYLWVVWEAAPGEVSGVDVFDVRELKRAARISTGRGEHAVAFSGDSRFAFVTNRDDGTVSVIDVRTLAKVRDVPTGREPVSVAFSPQGRTAWVTNAGDGALVAVAADRAEPVVRLQAAAGLGQVAFAPGGRFGFVVSPRTDQVHILDVARNRIVQTAKVEKEPDQIAFSKELAYVRHHGSEIVLMVPLAAIGQEGVPVPVIDTPGGQAAFGKGKLPSPALGIVRAPGANAVLMANPADRMVYYYSEGMAAPMGSFANYNRQPRAVLVLDRTLQERGPGSYETTVKLQRPGRYDVVFFLDAPRLVQCFEVAVAPSPELAAKRLSQQGARVDYLAGNRQPTAGEPFSLRFRLTDPVTREPKRDLRDVVVLSYQMPGTRQSRKLAREVEPGVYEAEIKADEPGALYVFVQSPSAGLPFRKSPPLVLDAGPPPAAAASPADRSAAERNPA
jgi:YVTN family beta-propeller protein